MSLESIFEFHASPLRGVHHGGVSLWPCSSRRQVTRHGRQYSARRYDRSSPMFKKMSVPERVRIAKEKTRRVVDHLHYLLELHENNAIVLYSPTLSQQIPESFAANAFNVFQQGMYHNQSSD